MTDWASTHKIRSAFVWADACCVCKWPIWSDMTGEYDGLEVFVVGHKDSEAHPWCAPHRPSGVLNAA